MGAKRRFGREAKFEAMRRVQLAGQVPEVGPNLGIRPGVLLRWKREFEAGSERASPGHGGPKSEKEELVALRRENARLREERDMLGKATALFAAYEKRGSR